MMKRMMHPKHGFCHSHDSNEEARLRSFGWVDDDTEQKVAAPATELAAEETPVRRTRGPNKPKE